MNKKWYLSLLVILLVFSGCGKDGSNQKVEREIVGGVYHLINPEEPLRGEVVLDIEKIREIDPYETNEFDLRGIDFKRSSNGELTFFHSTEAVLYRFGPDGSYLGKLTRLGQGPGEFLNFQFLNPFYVDQLIYVSGGRKLARFESSGLFVDERRIGLYPRHFVDGSRFFCRKTDWRGDNWTEEIVLVNMGTEQKEDFHETQFFQGDNIGAVQKPGVGGYTHPWGIPDVLFDFDNRGQRAYLCLNSEYHISVKNLAGETETVIEIPYRNIPITEQDKKELLVSFFNDEPEKWQIDSFPDQLVAIKNLKSLPNGYLAAYRVTGIETYEIDIFSPEGHYVYSVQPLESIPLDEVKFYGFGFARIKTEEDGFMIYEEYRIKNLPDIFKD